MSRHTPGPWKLSKRFQDKVDVLHEAGALRGASSMVIARVTVRLSWLREQEANARLIAAAPELFAALKALQKARGIWPDLQKQVDDAIAKAEGATS